MAYRDYDIVRIQEINLPCREKLWLVNSGNAVAGRTALEYMVDLEVDVILGKTESLEQDIGFVTARITRPGLRGIPGQYWKSQE
jgi:hypothetical protein